MRGVDLIRLSCVFQWVDVGCVGRQSSRMEDIKVSVER